MKSVKTVLAVPLLSAAFFLSSCGESYTEVTARHKEGLDSLRADLKKLGELIDEDPAPFDLAAPLDPAPSFKDNTKTGSNTSILIYEELADPTKELGDKDLMDLYLSNGLKNYFTWSSWEKDAPDNFEENLKAALGLRYLVGYKTLRYQAPAVGADLKYTAGAAVLGIYVFDRESGKIACAFPIAAASNPNINYSYKNGEDKASAAQRWARSNLWTNLRNQTLKSLAEKTAGTFKD